MATYKIPSGVQNNPATLVDLQLYGSKRLGTLNVNETMASLQTSFASNTFAHMNGGKQYEFTNHLGNVLATITDHKIPHNNNGTIDYYTADIESCADYYPFGMRMAGRSKDLNTTPYKYGFNGKLNDNEIAGVTGADLDFGARIYDSRIGRWLFVDAMSAKHPNWSPYNFAVCNAILNLDKDGNDTLQMNLGEPEVLWVSTGGETGYNIVAFKVSFTLIQKKNATDVTSDITSQFTKGSHEMYVATLESQLNTQGNDLPANSYDLRFLNNGEIQKYNPIYLDYGHNIIDMGKGNGQAIHACQSYALTFGCLEVGDYPSIEWDQNGSQNGFGNQIPWSSKDHNCGVSNDKLDVLKGMYDKYLKNNSTPGKFGFQLIPNVGNQTPITPKSVTPSEHKDGDFEDTVTNPDNVG